VNIKGFREKVIKRYKNGESANEISVPWLKKPGS